MNTSEPLHVAFVWHMHQPYYRSAETGTFHMPWARMHALKDYLNMVEILSLYPDVHQTFNLVPSLVEQLQDYARGAFADDYWQHTIKPAAELDVAERIFVVERMCERSNHPRAYTYPRYLQLAHKRESLEPSGWATCAGSFSTEEIRDLQIWFNLAWFGPTALAEEPLRSLVEQGRGFQEEDKQRLAQVQAAILSRVLPAYSDGAARGQIELATSPYFHPILPLLCDSDSARVASPNATLPAPPFAHPEDAAEQLRKAIAEHERVFSVRPRGLWCSEQAVGENILPLLLESGLEWTISDDSVLARSLSGPAARPRGRAADSPAFGSPYAAYRLTRAGGEIAIVFRDHTLSDLIGFTYKSWDSREAATDLLRRLGDVRASLRWAAGVRSTTQGADGPGTSSPPLLPLVVIALDGENAWEHYPTNGRDFLCYLYEGLSADDSLRCVTVSEHLRESPAGLPLDWLHTGSWIAADLLTWCGTPAQNEAWRFLHQARETVTRHRRPRPRSSPASTTHYSAAHSVVADAWHHVLVAEGSDWFWWFGDHHHTELDPVWDLHFRLHLQKVYRLLGQPVPQELFADLLGQTSQPWPAAPTGALAPVIDGVLTAATEWEAAGSMVSVARSTMQPSRSTQITEVRFGWQADRLCLLVVPDPSTPLEGLELDLLVSTAGSEPCPLLSLSLAPAGQVEARSLADDPSTAALVAAWKDVIEVSLAVDPAVASEAADTDFTLRIGRNGISEHIFRTATPLSPEERG